MKITLDRNGAFKLESIFYKKDLKKIHYYSLEGLNDKKISLKVYDKNRKELHRRLRKRAKVKT